ncbi:hypothetical protein [Nonlabens marinus]|uniref:Transmembrane protein n=1 Tax=Nonlabens marinus S1-08 TaxID=1454201 RepID=W8VNL3_9FLAO|nr:hypothetical protein [Nonlabens marinus]BAO54529.1 hypothetical protein NMS_0520 [Nonlabens marinus S1-08]
MKWLLRSWSFLSSPLFLPLLVSIWFFSYADSLQNPAIVLKLYMIAVLSAAIPLVVYTLLKVAKMVNSVHLSSTKERLIPLAIYAILIIILLRGVFQGGMHLPLYYFFIGLLMSTIVALVMALFKFKISLHMMGIAGILGFVIMISILGNIPLTYWIIGLCIAAGLTATSRLHMEAHSPTELAFGTIAGLFIQISIAYSYLV